MTNALNKNSFELIIKNNLHNEISQFVKKLLSHDKTSLKRYITINEVSNITGVSRSVLRQLTFARAMPHRKVKSRLIFDEDEIKPTISHYKKYGWADPDNVWDVTTIQSEIQNFRKEKERPLMIDEIIRKIVREELASFSSELKDFAQKDKERYYGRTVLTVKEAAKYFRTSYSTINSLIKEDGMPHLKLHTRSYIVLEEAEAFLWRETAKSYADEGNIYWKRILQRLDWEEKEREEAYAKALKRLEESTF